MATRTVDALSSAGWHQRAFQVGAQFGARAGLLLAVFGILAWVLLGASTRSVSADDLALPLLVILGIVLARAITTAPTRRLADVETRYERATEALREVSHRYLTTLEIKTRLEQRIVGQPASVVTLYEIAKRLETLRSADVYRGLLGAIVTFLEATACAIYLKEEGQFRLRVGWPDNLAGRPEILDADIELVAAAVHGRRVTTIRDFHERESRPSPGRTPAMVGPLIGLGTQPVGVIVVEHISLLNLSPASVRLFELIVDWASTTLQHAMQYEDAHRRAVDDAETGIRTPAYIVRRLREELYRSDAYRLLLVLIVVQVDDVSAITTATLPALVRSLAAIFQQNVRALDIVGHLPEQGRFGLILPMTSIEDARHLAERFDVAVRRYALQPYADRRLLSLSYGFAAAGRSTPNSDAAADPGSFLAQAVADLGPLSGERDHPAR